MKNGVKQLNIRTNEETVKKLKIIAIKKGTSVKEILNFLIKNFIENAEWIN